MKKIIVFVFTYFFLILATSGANAALIDNGNGLIYDTILDVTWMQDANFAFNGSYGSGDMTWFEAMDYAEQLSFGGFDDWRLPDANSLDGSGPSSGNNSELGEMSHLYYIGLENTSTSDTILNPDPFVNLPNQSYWTSTPYTQYSPTCSNGCAWWFEFGYTTGHQNWTYMSSRNRVLLVRDGGAPLSEPAPPEIAPIPEPATMFLFGLGLLGLAGVSRKK